MSEVKIKIIEVKEINYDGKKFLAYKTVAKNGKKMVVRFTQECSIKPKEACYVICDDMNCNVDTSRQYPVLWIKDVIRTEPFVRQTNVYDFISTVTDEEVEEHPFD